MSLVYGKLGEGSIMVPFELDLTEISHLWCGGEMKARALSFGESTDMDVACWVQPLRNTLWSNKQCCRGQSLNSNKAICHLMETWIIFFFTELGFYWIEWINAFCVDIVLTHFWQCSGLKPFHASANQRKPESDDIDHLPWPSETIFNLSAPPWKQLILREHNW